MTQATPRWLEYYTSPAARPPKQPPDEGPLKVLPWNIPSYLRTRDGWACWRYEYDKSWSKPPYIPDTQPAERAEPSDPQTWRSFEAAYTAYQDMQPHGTNPGRSYDGVSFALDERWGLVGVDLDHVSEHKRDAERIVQELNSYTEHTPGRDGLRIFVRGHLPEGRRRRDWVEMYVHKRFLTVTGQHLDGTPTEIRPSPRLYDTWQRWLQQGMRS